MFAGHLAVALGAKSMDERTSLSLLIGASFGIDLLWPVFLLIGIESVEIDPGNTAFTPFNFVSYPWSHSLLAVIVWATLVFFFAKRFGVSKRGSLLAGALVISHWVLDWLTHRPDLPLWPSGPQTGLGLWNSISMTLIVEGSILLLTTVLFLRSIKPQGWKGKVAFFSLLALVTVIWASGPFSPAPPNSEAVALVGLSMILLPLWGMWIDRTSHPITRGA